MVSYRARLRSVFVIAFDNRARGSTAILKTKPEIEVQVSSTLPDY